jgi:membrane-associated phospholipid phosphatase
VTRRRAVPWLLVAIAVASLALFVALTIAVTRGAPLGLDAQAFKAAADLRSPWLDTAAKLVTKLGLIPIVGLGVGLAAVLLLRRRIALPAVALVAGAALAWLTVWIIKAVVDRHRPPGPLVHTGGQSFPSAHAANSVGWLSIAIVLGVLISTRGGRMAAIAAGALLTVLVGLSRIYLRAHYASDVLAGEALAVAMYTLAVIAVLLWQAPRDR